MDDQSQPTYSDREIILEFFPATDEKLVPKPKLYFFDTLGNGRLMLRHLLYEKEVLLTPITPAGKRSALLSCDLCNHHAPRKEMQIYRANVPHDKRNYRYVCLCLGREGCNARRILNEPVKVLERLFE